MALLCKHNASRPCFFYCVNNVYARAHGRGFPIVWSKLLPGTTWISGLSVVAPIDRGGVNMVAGRFPAPLTVFVLFWLLTVGFVCPVYSFFNLFFIRCFVLRVVLLHHTSYDSYPFLPIDLQTNLPLKIIHYT